MHIRIAGLSIALFTAIFALSLGTASPQAQEAAAPRLQG